MPAQTPESLTFQADTTRFACWLPKTSATRKSSGPWIMRETFFARASPGLSTTISVPRNSERTTMTKPLNVGMIGYGFMGRPHSNAYRKVNNFLALEYRPVLKAACARSLDQAKAFAGKWGYESVETDW